MKKLNCLYFLLTLMFLVGIVSCSGKKESHEHEATGSGNDSWAELDAFHNIMMESFHPFMDSGNIAIARQNAEKIEIGHFLPGQPSADERNVDQVVLIVFRHRVQDDIDAEMKGVLALCFATGSAGICPVPQLIPLPGPAEVILAIDDRSRRADGNSFEVRARDSDSADPA